MKGREAEAKQKEELAKAEAEDGEKIGEDQPKLTDSTHLPKVPSPRSPSPRTADLSSSTTPAIRRSNYGKSRWGRATINSM